MIRELKQTLTQEMTKILDRLNNGYTMDFTGIVDKIYYINSIVFTGMDSPITSQVVEEVCTPLPPPIVEPPTPPGPVLTVPMVVTTEPTPTSNTTITSGGTIMSEGNTAVTQKGVCWVQNTNPTLLPTISDDLTIDGIGAAAYTSYLTNLQANTSYHIRAYAINSVGTSYGAKYTITTLVAAALPTVTTSTPSVTNSTIDTGGDVTDEGSDTVTARGVCISTSINPTINDLKSANGTGPGVFVSNFTGLSTGTTYYLRAYATNSIGTAYGNQIITATTAVAATVTTTTANGIGTTYAASGGNVSADGGSPVTSKGVCWSTSASPTTADTKTIDGAGIGYFTSYITGLLRGTLYYVRAYAVNGQGTTYGNQVSFTTSANVPTLTTTAVSNITLSGADSGGNITDDGGAAVTERGVFWNTTGNPTRFDTGTTSGTGVGVFTTTLGPLTENTTYYIRAYARNSAGWGYGNELSFTTLAVLATLDTTPASSITSTSANSGGTITFAGPGTISARGVCYDTFPNPDMGSTVVTVPSSMSPYTASMTGLTPDTLYYVRAYITYDDSPIYGQQISFITPASGVVPVVPTPNIVTIVSKTTTTITVSASSVIATGGAAIDQIGYVLKAAADPAITDNKVQVAAYNTATQYTYTGLTPGVSYYIKSYAHNSAGDGLGATTIQATDAAVVHSPPTVTIMQVSKNYNSITLMGTITDTGNDPVTAVDFGRKTSAGVLITDNPLSSALIGNTFTNTYYSLSPSTNYYFKAFATNVNGTGASSEIMITTDVALENPVVITGASYIATVDSLHVFMSLSGGDPASIINTQGFYWSVAPFTEAEIGRGNVYSYLSPSTTDYIIPGLVVDTTYYVRAVADIASPTADIAFGTQITMSTLAAPPVSPSNIMKSVTVGAPNTRLNYEVWLSNTTGSSINYRLRMQNVSKGGSWVIGPQMIIAAGVAGQLVTGVISSMGVNNANGDSIDIELSKTDGSTWDAILITDYTPPLILPYAGGA